MNVLAALVFGFSAGLRTVMPEAVYFGFYGGGIWRILFPVGAVFELIADLLPFSPARTTLAPLLGRCFSGALMGWIAARVPGAVAGVLGALIATFGGYRIRMEMIRLIGSVPAALAEDVVAIGLAFAGLAAMRLV